MVESRFLCQRENSLSLSLKASAIRDTNVGPGQKKIPRGKRYQRTLTRRLSILAHLTPFVRREKSFVRSVYEARGKRGSGTGWPIRKHRFVFLGYKGGRLLGGEKREKKEKDEASRREKRKAEKRDHTPSISEIDFLVRQCLVSLVVSFLFSAHPIPPSFYRRQTLSAAADENWLASHHSLRFGRGSHHHDAIPR